MRKTSLVLAVGGWLAVALPAPSHSQNLPGNPSASTASAPVAADSLHLPETGKKILEYTAAMEWLGLGRGAAS